MQKWQRRSNDDGLWASAWKDATKTCWFTQETASDGSFLDQEYNLGCYKYRSFHRCLAACTTWTYLRTSCSYKWSSSDRIQIVRFEVLTAVTMKNAVFWDINTVRISQETHYVSATKHSRLILCKIWGFQGGDYEECRLLGYKHSSYLTGNTLRFATQHSRLILCKIWGSHGNDYEECRLLGYNHSSYLTGNTLRFRYRVQPVNTM
jgi:hypothetical protein